MAIAAIAAIGVAASVAGTFMQMSAASKQAKAQKEATRAEMAAEENRRRAMELDAQRKKRETIRDTQVARAQAIAAGTNQGASESSAVLGGVAQIQGSGNDQFQGINNAREFGSAIFSNNQAKLAADLKYASAGAAGSIGRGISSLGGALVSDIDMFKRIG